MSSRFRRWGIEFYQKLSGRRITKAFDELLKTQWLSRDELFALQQRKLFRLIEYAHRYVPYYQRLFKQIGFEPGDLKKNPDCFRQLPLLDKAAIRESYERFFTTEPGIRKTLKRSSTSGSTGEPLVFWEDFNNRDYVTGDILRHLSWAGWEFGEPQVFYWIHSHNMPLRRKVREKMMNLALNRFISDASSLSEESMSQMARLIRNRRPRVIFGNSSAFYHFALYIRAKPTQDIRFLSAVLSTEKLFSTQRKVIEETFGCRVYDRYATSEVGGLACECSLGRGMHISVENCVLEILSGREPCRPGQPGEVIVTNLNNFGFPFIRYRLQDIVRLCKEDCACGRRHPLLEDIEGRQADRFKTRDGRLILGDLHSRIFEVEGIRQFRVIQKSLDLVLIQLVVDRKFRKSRLEVMARVIKRELGPETEVRVEFLDSIPTEKSGKFRFAVSEIPDDPFKDEQGPQK